MRIKGGEKMPEQTWIDDLAGAPDTPHDNVRLPEAITNRYGPLAVLSRLFIAADNMAKAVGIDLKFRNDFHSLIAVNEAEASKGSWYKMPDVFDPRVSVDLSPNNAFWIAAEDANGAVVATTCGRIFEWAESSLADEVRLLFYGGRELGQKCVVTAPLASEISGSVYYAGGVWVAPEYRSTGLSSLLPHVARGYAAGRWPINCAMNLTNVNLVEKGLPARYGYNEVSRSVFFPGSPLGDVEYAVCRLRSDDMYADFTKFAANWRDYVGVRRVA
jgi:GNAT superfamily N-acetyltransferase